MVHRRFWLKLLERAWKERSVVWLAGVRRVGKTCLCQDLPEVEYFDCELPRVRRMMLDPESFLDGLRGKRIVLDEIHRLQNPSRIAQNCSRPSFAHTSLWRRVLRLWVLRKNSETRWRGGRGTYGCPDVSSRHGRREPDGP